MATTKTRKRTTTKPAASLATNSNARKDAARKAGKCQICGEKTKGHSVVIDYDKGKVIKSAAGKAKAGHAFYCSDCADKKVTRYEWKLERKASPSTTGRGSRKQKRGSKATAEKPARKRTRGATKAKTAAKPKRTRTAKPKAEASKPKPKRVRKPKAASEGAEAQTSSEPF